MAATGHFHAYELYTFPNYSSEISKFILIETDYPIFMINVEKQYYSELEAADLVFCKGGNTKVCPADKILLRLTITKCESALFFNKPQQIHSLCSRKIRSPHFTPQFIRSNSY
jgi:hypothetical protein